MELPNPPAQRPGRSALAGIAGLLAVMLTALVLVLVLRGDSAPVAGGSEGTFGGGSELQPVQGSTEEAGASSASTSRDGIGDGAMLASRERRLVAAPGQPSEGEGPHWSGEVVQEGSREPVAGARVMVFDSFLQRDGGEADYDPPVPVSETVTGADGQFSLPILSDAQAPTDLVLVAHADGFAGKAEMSRTWQRRAGVPEEVRLELPPADEVRGRVVDEDGRGISGAIVGDVVLTYGSTGSGAPTSAVRDSAWTVSETDGSFSLAGTSPGTAYWLRARARGYARAVADRVPSDARDVVIVLASGPAAVRGVVLNSDGLPADGETVSAAVTQPRGSYDTRTALLGAGTTTNSSGEFELTGLPAGDWTVTAQRTTVPRSQEIVRTELRLAKDDNKYVELRFPPLVTLTGRAFDVDTDAGVAGVLVSDSALEITTDDGTVPIPDAVAAAVSTGVNGRFSIDVPASTRMLRLKVPEGWLETASNRGFIPLEPPLADSSDELQIPLRSGDIIRGIVYQQDGVTPASGGSVSAKVDEENRGGSQTAEIGADGRFSVSVEREKPYVIRAATAEGWGTTDIGTDHSEEAVIVLEAYARITGTVTDGEDNGLGGISIGSRPTEEFSGWRRWYTERTAADGTYELSRVIPGKNEVFIQSRSNASFIPPEPVAVEVAAGELLEGVDIVIGEGDFIEGVVMNEEGEPIQGARVNFTRYSPQYLQGNIITDEDGYFRISGLPQNGVLDTVRFSAAGYVSKSLQDVTALGGSLSITLQETGSRELVVQDERGQPVTRYEYALFSSAGGTRAVSNVPVKRVQDPEGRTSLASLSPGGKRVAVLELDEESKPTGRGGAARFNVNDGTEAAGDVVVTLNDGATVRGKVINALTEEPVAGALVKQVTNERSGGFFGFTENSRLPDRFLLPNAVTDRRGEFVITGVQPGTWYLTANAEGMSAGPDGVPVTVLEGAVPAEVTIPMSALGAIYGVVIGADGEPLAGANVSWTAADTWDLSQVQADAEGRYRIDELTEGKWRVSVSDAEDRSQQREIEVQGDEVEVNFDLSGLIRVTGTVILDGRSWTQVPEAGILLSHTRPGVTGRILTPRNGERFEVFMPPGEILVHLAQGHNRRGLLQSITVEPSPPVQEFVIDAQTASADYAIEMPEGEEFPDGLLQFVQVMPNGEENGNMSSWNAAQRGHFPQIAAGRYKATFRAGNLFTGETEWQDVRPGSSEVFVIFVEKQEFESELARVQRMLNELGYDAGPVDGIMGPMTEGALRAFQTANGLDVTGTATGETVSALQSQTGG